MLKQFAILIISCTLLLLGCDSKPIKPNSENSSKIDSNKLNALIDSTLYHSYTKPDTNYYHFVIDNFSSEEVLNNYKPQVIDFFSLVSASFNDSNKLIYKTMQDLSKKYKLDYLSYWSEYLQGRYLQEHSDLKGAITIYTKLLEHFKKSPLDFALYILNKRLGLIYYDLNDYNLAVKHLNNSLPYFQSYKSDDIIYVYQCLFYSYLKLKNSDLSLFYAKKLESTGMYHSLGLKFEYEIQLYSINQSPLDSLKKYFTAFLKCGSTPEGIGIYSNYLKILIDKNRLNEAHEVLKLTLNSLDSIILQGSDRNTYMKNKVILYKIAHDLFDSLGDIKMKYKYLQLYSNLKEEYNSDSTNYVTKGAETEFNFNQEKIKLIHEQDLTQEKLSFKQKQTNYFILVTGLLLSLSIYIFNNLRKQKKTNEIITKQKELIEIEQHRSDQLLLNILPSDIAEELKTKGTAKAKLFNDVTVLFTDFKNFTIKSELFSPQELVDELHQCFKGFDEIISKYNIEKIKTVGDAYLAVSGLPIENPNHAFEIVKASIEIRNFMINRKKLLNEKTFEVRIGIHSGSVVAGIVGVKKFAYDIWGDTVNTAARMEQNSESNKINLSESTFNLVKDQFAFVYRVEITAKKKGSLKMYFVL